MNDLQLAARHFAIARFCIRLGASIAAFAVLLLSGIAAAQEAAPAPPTSAGALGLQLLAQMLPLLATILGMLLTALVVIPLRKWLTAKADTSAIAGVALKAEHFAEGVVADINATMVPELASALADGVITDAEAKHLRETAMNRLKEQLGTRGLAELSGVLGIGGKALEQYLAGVVEKKVEAAKGAGNAAALAVVDGQAAVAEINR